MSRDGRCGAVGMPRQGSQIPPQALFPRILPALSRGAGGEHWSTPEMSLAVNQTCLLLASVSRDPSIPQENLGDI